MIIAEEPLFWISSRSSAPKKHPCRHYHYVECHSLQRSVLFLKGSVIFLQVNTSDLIPGVLSPEINRTGNLGCDMEATFSTEYITWNLSQILANLPLFYFAFLTECYIFYVWVTNTRWGSRQKSTCQATNSLNPKASLLPPLPKTCRRHEK